MSAIDAQPKETPGVETEWLPAEVPSVAQSLQSEGVGKELAVLLARRGVDSAQAAQRFLNPSLDQLLCPLGLPGMVEAVSRLKKALAADERVAVVGDYDADGISGTAVLVASLRIAGLMVESILPHRLKDGYGFQPSHVEQAEQRGCCLIVTVDCGMSSVEAVSEAAARKIDVIITDHHLPGDERPAALAVVNPQLPHSRNEPYLNRDLCGAGIALKLGSALLHELDLDTPTTSLLRVACLGTIADLVPLTGENRAIAALGLRALETSRSPGLKALMQVAKVRPPILAEDVSFRLAPRINAAGRLDSPDRALELLLTRDEAEARSIAAELDRWNQERQEAEKLVVSQAREQFLELSRLPRVLVGYSESWHRGVVGIAAGRLAREFHRPTVLLEVCGEEATGSGRSINAVDLHEFLSPWRHRLLRFGGHSQAIGMTVATEDLPDLVDQWNQKAESWPDDSLTKRLHYELEVDNLTRLKDQVYGFLEKLQPFGMGNPTPLIRVGPVGLARPARFFGKGHLDLLVQDAHGGRIRVTGWNWAQREAMFQGRFEVLARLTWDSYLASPALTLVDARRR